MKVILRTEDPVFFSTNYCKNHSQKNRITNILHVLNDS